MSELRVKASIPRPRADGYALIGVIGFAFGACGVWVESLGYRTAYSVAAGLVVGALALVARHIETRRISDGAELLVEED